jgi:putative ABC transport system substrate-binding protein
MQRREFIILFGAGAAAWPLVVRAQQPTMPVIGWVAGGSRNNTYERYLASFRQGLSEAGFVEGRDVTHRDNMIISPGWWPVSSSAKSQLL